MPLLHFWAPCSHSLSALAALLLFHTAGQQDMGVSSAFSIHISCFTDAPAPLS